LLSVANTLRAALLMQSGQLMLSGQNLTITLQHKAMMMLTF